MNEVKVYVSKVKFSIAYLLWMRHILLRYNTSMFVSIVWSIH